MNIAANHPFAERAAWADRRAAFDPREPQGWFMEQERNDRGEVVDVATILLTNRECPWRCLYCDLWKGTTLSTVPEGAIPAQIDSALARLQQDNPAMEREPRFRHLKLYNAGSFFDPKAIPSGDLPAIAARARSFERVVVECHPSLVGESALRFRDLLRPDRLEVAMGLEVADDALLRKLNRRMTLAQFRRAADFLRSNGIDVRAFIIVKPPFVVDEHEAERLAGCSIDFAFECGAAVAVIIPARRGPAELEALADVGMFELPKLSTLESVVDYGVAAGGGRVFADLWDIEKLEGCAECFPGRVARLRDVNLGQATLPPVQCAACSERSAKP